MEINPISKLRKTVEMNPINVLRQFGLLETLAFKYSNIPYGYGWSFNNTYEYYVDMSTRPYWHSI